MQPLRVVSLSKLRDSSDWAKVALSSGLWRAAPRLCGGPLRGCGGPLRGHGGPLRGHGYPVALNSQLLQPGSVLHDSCEWQSADSALRVYLLKMKSLVRPSLTTPRRESPASAQPRWALSSDERDDEFHHVGLDHRGGRPLLRLQRPPSGAAQPTALPAATRPPRARNHLKPAIAAPLRTRHPTAIAPLR